ncbi:hypothetical protein ACFSUS_09945 [Spirosoma soli]|uniref:Uncharacterized protein n=1 Tax=Spirosoma soli TaxID=1770529 RepID=A0ABW5M1U9_9BACT
MRNSIADVLPRDNRISKQLVVFCTLFWIVHLLDERFDIKVPAFDVGVHDKQVNGGTIRVCFQRVHNPCLLEYALCGSRQFVGSRSEYVVYKVFVLFLFSGFDRIGP